MDGYHVKNLHVDLHNSLQHFDNSRYDFQVIAKYIDTNHYDLIVRRLDQVVGWNIQLYIMACDFIHDPVIHTIPITNQPEIIIPITTDYEIYPSTKPVQLLPAYQIPDVAEPIPLSRIKFNELFNTDIVALPVLLYATGVCNNHIYMYNESYGYYFEIIQQIKYLLSIAMLQGYGKENTEPFYFIIAGNDGYPEGEYQTVRNIPRQIGENEYNEGKVIIEKNEYCIYHSKKYIVTQSQHLDLDYSIGMPDRHYLLCNLYNPFRSIHKGILFQNKIPKMVNASRYDRGQKENFMERQDLDLIPRQYFLTDAVDKSNLHYSQDRWIDSHEMVNYKYILDIDGRASTWDATAWKLNSGSIIMKQTSPWRQWFYDEYLPWVHYVPIANDFSDLQEKFQWCESHQEECEAMIQRCLELFQKIFRFHNVIEYTKDLIETITHVK